MAPSRRGMLAMLVATVSAGCSGPGVGIGSEASPGTGSTRRAGTDTESMAAGTREAATPTGEPTAVGDLDLREANVTAVVVQREGDAVRFDVTLIHNDDGEDGYANWWQVERLDGTRIGRRELLHAHGTQEFTRSDRFEVPADVTCVVVRGHDQTHGYGGQAALVELGSGAVRLVGQGSDPVSFDEGDCH